MDTWRVEPHSGSPGVEPARLGTGSLSLQLVGLRHKLERDCPLRLALDIGNRELADALAPELAAAIHTILQQAVLSAADHGGATLVKVAVHVGESSVLLCIDSNGAGFPFKGSHDLPELLAFGIGPQALAQLVAVYHGWMRLSAGAEGSRIAISVPRDALGPHVFVAE